MDSYDAIVVGLGGAGSSAAYHLATGGRTVLGLERFEVAHANGSSHGRTRIYRTAYSEGPKYVPLMRRAEELWLRLETESGPPIIRRTGGLFLGRPETRLLAGALRTAEALGLPHERLSASEVEGRFPQFRIGPSEAGIFDPNAGALFPENAIRAHLAGAERRGAELRFGTPVTSWSASTTGVTVRTPEAEYHARSLVFTSGSWTTSLLPDLALPLTVERQAVVWYPTADPELVRPGRMPVFLWDLGGEREKYGLPDFGDGVKVGSWGGRAVPTPEAADRTFRDEEAAAALDFARSSLRGVEPRIREWTTCLYTLAPDRDFLIGRHPRHANVTVVSACSGHGFKFTSVLGEIVTRLVDGADPGFDLSAFDVGRFARWA